MSLKVPDRSEQMPPSAVVALAHRLGAGEPQRGREVRMRQSGRLRQDEAASWLPFTAQQTISTNDCRFSWDAKVGPAGLVRVTDAIDATGGHLRAALLGLLTLADAQGDPAVTRGELMRYLAELAWAPDAILANPNLCWREESSDRLIVSVGSGDLAASVTLELDTDGRIASAFAPDRPRAVGKMFAPTPWRGRFWDYRLHLGRWLPLRGEVAWIEDSVEAVCWEGELLDWRVTDPAEPSRT